MARNVESSILIKMYTPAGEVPIEDSGTEYTLSNRGGMNIGNEILKYAGSGTTRTNFVAIPEHAFSIPVNPSSAAGGQPIAHVIIDPKTALGMWRALDDSRTHKVNIVVCEFADSIGNYTCDKKGDLLLISITCLANCQKIEGAGGLDTIGEQPFTLTMGAVGYDFGYDKKAPKFLNYKNWQEGGDAFQEQWDKIKEGGK